MLLYKFVNLSCDASYDNFSLYKISKFKTFEEISIAIWLPDGINPVELTEEDVENGYIGYFMSEDESAVVAVMYVDVDGMSLEEYAEYLSAEAGAQFPGIMHTNAAPVARSRFAVSENHAENMIAMLAALPAGRMVVGSPQFDEAFIEDLRRSFGTPLKVAEGDSGETAHLKKVVEKIKGDLKASMDRGEDVAATLSDTFKELQKLGVYRFVLDRELAKLEQTDGVSDEDMDDFVKAANIMLEEKGLEPISLGRTARAILGEGEPAEDRPETEDQT